MKPVRVSRRAYSDLVRLEEWLVERDAPVAAARLVRHIVAAIDTLEELPERGRQTGDGDIRELLVPFGGARYIVQYQIGVEATLVMRVFHSREQR